MLVIIGDIETYKEYFLCRFYDPQKDEWLKFEVSKFVNSIDRMVRYILSKPDYYFVFYNGLRFDTQIIEYIIRYSEDWDIPSMEICNIIYEKAIDVIDNANYDILPSYPEAELSFKTIDPFEIHHFSNKHRLISLKQLEFEMDLENIETMPIPPSKQDLSLDDLHQIDQYCKNDVWALYHFYLITIGNTDHPLYKDNNQIELRQNIEKEFDISCLNYSDSKIGDEIIKKTYCDGKNIRPSDLPKKGTFIKSVSIRDCIASYVHFQTKELSKFLFDIKKVSLGMKDEFKRELSFYGNNYSFMRGGLHTDNKPAVFMQDDNYILIDWDVASYYPAIIINNGRYPKHLGREFIRGYEYIFQKRLSLKSESKTNNQIKGVVAALKIAVNSVFGKSSDIQSWMYDRSLTMFTTITGELSLMMLIEAYELAGIHVISANTDGVTIRIHKSFLDKMDAINSWWMTLTGFVLERTNYKKIVFASVNDYIALKTDGTVKRKGEFTTDYELYKNKSASIIPIALGEYFINGADIGKTIRSHDNIYSFCIRQKSSKCFHYEGVDKQTHRTTVYNKLIRYYVSTTGEKVYKVKNKDCHTNAVEMAQIEAGQWLCTICNYLPKSTRVADCNIDFSYYIGRAERIVKRINKSYECEGNTQQLSLW